MGSKHIVTFLSLWCCAAFFQCRVKEPELMALTDVRIISAQDSTIIADIICQVKNPNTVGATLNRMDGEVKIAGVAVGQIHQDSALKLSGQTVSDIKVRAHLNIARLSEAFPALLNQDSAMVELTGHAKLDLGMASVNKKMDIQQMLPVRAILAGIIQQKIADNSIFITKVMPRQVSPGQSEIYIEAEITNNLGIAFELRDLDMDVYMGDSDKPFANWKRSEPVVLEKGAKTLISGVSKVDNLNLLSQGLAAMFGKREALVKGYVTAYIQQHDFRVPVRQVISLAR